VTATDVGVSSEGDSLNLWPPLREDHSLASHTGSLRVGLGAVTIRQPWLPVRATESVTPLPAS